MAKDKGYLAKIGADISGFQEAMKSIKKETGTLTKELNSVSHALKLDPSNTTLQAQKLELLKQKAEQASKELDELTKAKEVMEKVGNDGTTEGAAALREYEREIEKCKRYVREYTEYQQKLNDGGATAGITKAKVETEKAASATANWADVFKGNLLSGAVTQGLEMLCDALKKIGEEVLTVGMNFESSMAQTAATFGIDSTTQEYEKLSQAAQKYGASTKYTAAQTAEALNYLALAGYSVDESIADIPNVLNLAQAGGMDLAQASDMLTDSMSALGLVTANMSEEMKADAMAQFADEMAKTSQRANASVEDVGEAVLAVGASAQGLNKGSAELNTLVGVLADVGIKGAEGGTHIRNILKTLKENADVFKDMGVDVYDLNGNLNYLPDIIQQFGDSMNGLTSAEKDAKILDIFNSTDLAAINALLGTTSERFDELYGEIANSSGTCAEMAEIMNDTLEGAITSCTSAWEGFCTALYSSVDADMKNAVQNVANVVQQMVAYIDDNDATVFDESKLDEYVQKISEFIADFSKNLKEKIRVIGMELIPALMDAINEHIEDVVADGTEIVMMLVQGLINALPKIQQAAVKILSGLVVGISNSLPQLLPVCLKIIGEIAENLTENIDTIIDAAYVLIEKLVEALCNPDSLAAFTEACVKIVTGISSALIDVSYRLGDAIWELATAIAKGIVNVIFDYDWEGAFEQMGDNIIANLRKFWDSLPRFNINDLFTDEEATEEIQTKQGTVNITLPGEVVGQPDSRIIYDDDVNVSDGRRVHSSGGGSHMGGGGSGGRRDSNGAVDINSLTSDLSADVWLNREDTGKPINVEIKPGVDTGMWIEPQTTTEQTDEENKRQLSTKYDEDLKKAMNEIDDFYAIHDYSEEEYYKKRKEALEQYRDEDSKQWWSYKEEIDKYYQSQEQQALEQTKKVQEEANKKQTEAEEQRTKLLKASIQTAASKAKTGRSNKDVALVNEGIAELKALLSEIDTGSETYEECLKALNEGKDELTTLQSSLETIDIKQRQQDIEYQQAVNERAYGELKAAKQYYEDIKQFVESIEGTDYYTQNAQSLQKKLWAAEDAYKKAYVADYKEQVQAQIDILDALKEDFEDSVVGDKWYAEQLQLIIDSIDNADVAEAFESKLSKAKSDVEKDAENAEKAIVQAAQKYQNAIQYFRDGETLDGKDSSIINDLSKQREQIREAIDDIQKLRDKGFSEDYIADAITPLSVQDGSRQKAIEALLGLTEEQIRQELADYEGLKADMFELAKVENTSSTEDIATEAVDTASNALSKAISEAYKIGQDTADAFNKGITDGLGVSTNTVLNAQSALAAQGIDTQKVVSPTTATISDNKGSTVASKSDNITISVSVAGVEVIRRTVDDMLRQNIINGGNSLYI